MDGAIRNPRPINKDTSTHPAAHGMRGTAVALPSSRVIILTGSGDAINTPINPARSSVAPITLKIFLFVIILLTERQRSPSVHLVHRRGGTPCWDLCFGCSCPGPVRNRGRAVDALCGRVVEDPFHVR